MENHLEGIEIIDVEDGWNIIHDVMYEISRYKNYQYNNLYISEEMRRVGIIKKEFIDHSSVHLVSVWIPSEEQKDAFLLQLNKYIADQLDI